MPTVLYVDQQPAMARAATRWLAPRGTRVHAARTIADAKHHFDTDAYDGVFIDLWLHDGSGFELYDWIVEHRPALADRVAFLTADIIHDPVRRDRFQRLDRPVLVKPFDLAELDRCVEGWVAGAPADEARDGSRGRGASADRAAPRARGGGTADAGARRV